MHKPFWVVLFGLITSCGPQNSLATLVQGGAGSIQQKGVLESSGTAKAVRGERSHGGESIFHMTPALKDSLLDTRVFNSDYYGRVLCERLGQELCETLGKADVEAHWLKLGSRDCWPSSERFNARELFPGETEDCRPRIVSWRTSNDLGSLQ